MKRSLFVDFAVMLIVVVLGLALATDYPVTVTDDLGRAVTVDAAPTRIVAMIPSHTETVCTIGSCELLVGVDDFSNYPAEAAELPRLGSGFSPNIEAIVALEPDLVLVDEYSGLAEALEPLGIVVFAGTPQTLAETYDLFATIGLLLDRESEAAVLAGRIQGQIRGVEARLEGVDRPTVYFELDATPYSVGPESFIGQIIAAAGGENIVPTELGDFPQLDPEFVISRDPETIVLADAPFGESQETLSTRPGWSSMEALQAGRVLELDQSEVDMINRAGPRLGDAVILLARWLHPGRF